ncbi:hypothetical protein EDC01DRAFT_661887 [Geopyxis carbonaria]|nr:hypothetical protein EDC01DRAFT_661887 [Geopyxis carbonaria]
MRLTTPRLWMLIGAVLLVTAVVARDEIDIDDGYYTPDEYPDEPQTTALDTTAIPPPPPKSAEDLRKLAEASNLVGEARAILRSLNAAPSTSQQSVSKGLVSTLWFFTKQMLLWHTPESLEEPAVKPVGGAHGRKLRTAVEKLEGARGLTKNEDAIFLLAEMNFYGNWSHPRDYKTAFTRYKELADLNGNSTAQNMVGFMYATGVGGGVERDQAKALLYHTFAALNGNTRSEMTIAFRHYTGIGTPRHCEEAAYYYRRVAEKAMNWYESGPPGGHNIQRHTYRLADDEGGVYGEGASAISSGLNGLRQRSTLDSAKDVGDIVEYLELLARKGSLAETFSLGKLYYDGSRNIPRDVVRAKGYFESVARQHWRDGKVIASGPPNFEKWAGKAAGYLGTMALRGEAGRQDFKAAARWFTRGISTGDANSVNGMGYMHLYGFGREINRQTATTMFRSATNQDLPAAQVNLAKILLENSELDLAKRYLELAARHGNVEAFYYLAEINNAGTNKERSCGLATAYYKIVSEKVEDLQSPLAWANARYAAGDTESAIIGYMMAAEQGYESGQANVAYLLDAARSALPLAEILTGRPGKTISKADQELALIYWTRSAKQANTDSLVKMGDYYLAGIGAEADPEKAASCYLAASEHQASAQALWNLGWMHENGIGMAQDFHLAKRSYDAAFETNGEAYLPVTLSLLKLRVRSFWNVITHGGVNDIGPPDTDKKPRLTFREFITNWYQAAAAQNAELEEDEALGVDAHLPGDEYFDEGYEEDLAESIVILMLAGAVAALVYYRQYRQQAAARRRRDEEERIRQNGGRPVPAQPQQQPDGGVGMPPNGIWGDGQPGWGMPH